MEETLLNRYFTCFQLEVLVVNGALTLKSSSSLHGLYPLSSLKKAKRTGLLRKLTDLIIAVTGISIKSELAGVVHLRTYSCFESLKVRDYRLEPVLRYSFYKRIRKDSKQSRSIHYFSFLL